MLGWCASGYDVVYSSMAHRWRKRFSVSPFALGSVAKRPRQGGRHGGERGRHTAELERRCGLRVTARGAAAALDAASISARRT